MVEFNDVGGRAAVLDEINDFDAGTFQVVHEGTGTGTEEGIAEPGWNGDDEAESRGDEALINPMRDIGGSGEAVGGRKTGEAIEQADQGAEQTDEGADVGEGVQQAEEALETRHFELAGLLNDFFELLPRHMMAKEGGMNDTSGGHASGDALLQGLGEVSTADEGGEPGEEFAHIHAGAMKIGQSLQKDGSGDAQAPEEQPDERSAFGDKLQGSGGAGEVNHESGFRWWLSKF